MECKAIQTAVSRDWMSGKMKIEYTIESGCTPEDIERARGKNLRLRVVEWREKRSLDANAYYWQLLTKLADKLGISKPFAHNLMLRRYGQPEIIDGRMVYAVLPDSDSGTRIADEAETYHIKPTSEIKVGTGGMNFRTYIMLRGSSTYDTNEMSKLINGLVLECKEQDIETLPPDELKRMMQVYEKNGRNG